MYARVGDILIEDDGGVAYGSQKRDRQPTSKPAAAQISRSRRAADKSEVRKEPSKAKKWKVSVGRVAVQVTVSSGE